MSRGLVEGFQAGWGMMNQHNQQQENKRRYDQQVALEQQRYDDQKMQRDEIHNANMANSALQRQALQHEVDNLQTNSALNQQVKKAQIDSVNTGTASRQFKLNSAKEAKKKASLQERLAIALQQEGERPGTVSNLIQSKDFDSSNMVMLRDRDGRQQAKTLQQGIDHGLRTGDFSGAVGSYNKLFKRNLNRAVGSKSRDGSKIRDVEVVGFEGGFGNQGRIRVKVTTEKGAYDSYVSELRSADPNDKVKFFSGEEIFRQATSMGMLADVIEQSGIPQTEAVNSARYMSALNPQQNNVPSETQNVRNQARAMGLSEGEVWALRSMARQDPQRYQLARTNLIMDRLNNDTAYISAETPQEKQAIEQQAIATVDRLLLGQGNQPQQAPAQGANPQQAQLLQQLLAAQAQQRSQ
ncbi:hypothetical protein J7384_16995 [Endozoicomonas sp. G2_1]|uniref:hypothetical protein n=1 Tax=Endozoicomonas sp. G2_1 TaxID=2821091 RepID=UPI001ADC25A8|nr:hypothetical protein [Endozoicomonas sp. G2_1]MBO9492061.1 hypothetical protein [Endozoicomonas sp. G2_1]